MGARRERREGEAPADGADARDLVHEEDGRDRRDEAERLVDDERRADELRLDELRDRRRVLGAVRHEEEAPGDDEDGRRPPRRALADGADARVAGEGDERAGDAHLAAAVPVAAVAQGDAGHGADGDRREAQERRGLGLEDLGPEEVREPGPGAVELPGVAHVAQDGQHGLLVARDAREVLHLERRRRQREGPVGDEEHGQRRADDRRAARRQGQQHEAAPRRPELRGARDGLDEVREAAAGRDGAHEEAHGQAPLRDEPRRQDLRRRRVDERHGHARREAREQRLPERAAREHGQVRDARDEAAGAHEPPAVAPVRELHDGLRDGADDEAQLDRNSQQRRVVLVDAEVRLEVGQHHRRRQPRRHGQEHAHGEDGAGPPALRRRLLGVTGRERRVGGSRGDLHALAASTEQPFIHRASHFAGGKIQRLG
mmetsp:Transcript_28254/g.96242  ORF Transcript_28254/g.96242 Transcript_28254/m.96242 type:complete len:429 (+) Transcript_28254:1-1287(+)